MKLCSCYVYDSDRACVTKIDQGGSDDHRERREKGGFERAGVSHRETLGERGAETKKGGFQASCIRALDCALEVTRASSIP